MFQNSFGYSSDSSSGIDMKEKLIVKLGWNIQFKSGVSNLGYAYPKRYVKIVQEYAEKTNSNR